MEKISNTADQYNAREQWFNKRHQNHAANLYIVLPQEMHE